MKPFMVLVMVSVTLAKYSKYSDIIKRDDVRQLYLNYKLESNQIFTGEEDDQRFNLFKERLMEVDEENSEAGETAHYTINKFSVWTDEERMTLLTGINMTKVRAAADYSEYTREDRRSITRRSKSPPPEEKLWTDEGAVTTVQDQGWCGSCWTYSAAGAVETNYKIATGVLRKFSEKEFLDCSYEADEPDWDGCNGGWYNDAFQYSIKKGRLASAADYQYDEIDGICKGKDKADGLQAAKIKHFVTVGKDEESHIEILALSAISVAYQVTDKFYNYERGIYKDNTCIPPADPNHAVTMIGYTPEYVLVKNSWGIDWGDKGFVKFVRNYHNCGIWYWSSYPVMESTGVEDTMGEDTATVYNPDPADDCVDDRDDCELHFCFIDSIVSQECKRTCHTCDDDDDADGNGLIQCADKIYRHRHACRFHTGQQ